MRELQVASLAAGLGTEQEPRWAAKALDGPFFLQPRQSTMKYRDIMSGLPEPPLQELLRGPELSEDHDLVEKLAEKIKEAIDLRILAMASGAGRKLNEPRALGIRKLRLSAKLGEGSGCCLTRATHCHLKAQ